MVSGTKQKRWFRWNSKSAFLFICKLFEKQPQICYNIKKYIIFGTKMSQFTITTNNWSNLIMRLALSQGNDVRIYIYCM